MEALRVDLDLNRYDASYVYWNGTGSSTLPCEREVEPEIMIYKNRRDAKLPTPWYIKTNDVNCETILIHNNLYYPITVVVDGTSYEIDGKSDVAAPAGIYMSQMFTDMCEDRAVYGIQRMGRVYNYLCKLTWQTGVNAFLELV